MTPTQKAQFNRMRNALIRISKHYQTPDQIRREASRGGFMGADESMGYAYENIQQEAKAAVSGVREA